MSQHLPGNPHAADPDTLGLTMEAQASLAVAYELRTVALILQGTLEASHGVDGNPGTNDILRRLGQ